MIQPYKDRTAPNNQIVEVYRNLNNNLFSIRCTKTKQVLAHGNDFILLDATPKVSEAGRQRVIKEKRKNVHAYVTGRLIINSNDYDYEIFDELYYDPYTQDRFSLGLHKCEFISGDLLFKDGKGYVLINSNEVEK